MKMKKNSKKILKPGILKEIKKKKNELEPLINKENDIEKKIMRWN